MYSLDIPLRSKGQTDFDAQQLSFQLVHSPRILAWIAVLVAVLLVGLAIGLVVLPWQQVSVGNGKVIAYAPQNRDHTIDAPLAGRIKQWLVTEGTVVQAGDPIVILEDQDPLIVQRLEIQQKALYEKLGASKRALEVSKRNVLRQKELTKLGLSSEREYELTEIEVAKFASEVAVAEQEVAAIQTTLAKQLSQLVRADTKGVIAKIFLPQGGVFVPAGSQLALLVPETQDRAVEVLVSGMDVPLISKGRKVRLQFEGWPAIQFAGWPSVAVGTFGGVVEFVDAVPQVDGKYRVIVFPDPSEPPWPTSAILRQGGRVMGWIILERVTLGWEMWRRLNDFPLSVQEVPREST